MRSARRLTVTMHARVRARPGAYARRRATALLLCFTLLVSMLALITPAPRFVTEAQGNGGGIRSLGHRRRIYRTWSKSDVACIPRRARRWRFLRCCVRVASRSCRAVG
jgi:hypothetical protein